MIVKENIEFKRGLSYPKRKSQLTGHLVPGQILIGPSWNNIFVYEETKDQHLWGYSMGNLSLNYKGKAQATFIFNTKDGVKKIGIREDRGNIPNQKKKRLILKAFDNQMNQKYLNLVKEKTGLNPFV